MPSCLVQLFDTMDAHTESMLKRAVKEKPFTDIRQMAAAGGGEEEKKGFEPPEW